jgi:hypothetical protein
MAEETPAERAERLRKFAAEQAEKVAKRQEDARNAEAEKKARGNLDKKDSES